MCLCPTPLEKVAPDGATGTERSTCKLLAGDGAAAGAVGRKGVLLEGAGSDPAREAGPHRKRKGDRERTVKPGGGLGYGRTARLAAHSPRADSPSAGSPLPLRLQDSRTRDDKCPRHEALWWVMLCHKSQWKPVESPRAHGWDSAGYPSRRVSEGALCGPPMESRASRARVGARAAQRPGRGA